MTSSHEPQSRPPVGRIGFTLVEMLVVLAIIAIVTLVAAPLFTNPADNGRQSAKVLLRSHLNQARAHALATGKPTAVLIPDSRTTESNGGLLGIAEVESSGGPNPPYRVTSLIQRWISLPDTMFFLGSSALNLPVVPLTDREPVAKATYRTREVDCYGVVFAPDGRIIYPAADGKPLALAIGQGRRTPSGVTSTLRGGGGKPIHDLVQVNRLNGRMRSLDPSISP